MPTTIEQKLSAIRAINEQKDTVDLMVNRIEKLCAAIPSDQLIAVSIVGPAVSIPLPERTQSPVGHVVNVPGVQLIMLLGDVKQHYEQQRQELITKAETLMK